uniref:AsmA-like C-terminal domain-containing protein n=1 Tax=Magnetococcus massalia (strain MO-1) TaxID=451514 RepID=A0A1S7LJ59_MAGMO|nr:protein of unknown function [Candidatus Magnetococcus massalia]
MQAAPSPSLFRTISRLTIRIIFFSIILLAITSAVLQVDESRRALFAQLKTFTGWDLQVDVMHVGIDHVHLERIHLKTAEGASFECDELRMEWGPLDLLLWKLNSLRMESPVWHFALPEKSENSPKQYTPDSWADMLQKDVMPSTLWPLGLRVDHLEIDRGEVAQVGDAPRAWRLDGIRVFGERLTRKQGQLVFAGLSKPGGLFSGHVQWDDTRHMVLHAREMSLKPWFGLMQVELDSGTMDLDLDLRIQPGEAVKANGQVTAQDVKTASGWQGDSTLFLTMRNGRIHWNGSGSVVSDSGAKKPLLMSGTLFHEREEWNIPDGTLKLGDVLDSSIRLRWKERPEWQLTTNMHSPLNLAQWLTGRSWTPAGMQWLQQKPWRLSVGGNGAVSQLQWDMELETGPDRVLYQGTEAKDVRASLTARGKGGALSSPMEFKLSAASMQTHHGAMRYIETRAEAQSVADGRFSLDSFRIGGEFKGHKGRFQPLSWRGDALSTAQGVSGGLSSLNSVLHWQDSRMEITYRDEAKDGHFSDAGWQMVVPESHPIAFKRMASLIGRELGQGKLHGRVKIWRDHATWKSRLNGQVDGLHWSGPLSRLGLADDAPTLQLKDVQLKSQGKLILDPRTHQLRADLDLNLPSGAWQLADLSGALVLEKPTIDLIMDGTFEGARYTPHKLSGQVKMEALEVLSWQWQQHTAGRKSLDLSLRGGDLEHLFSNYCKKRLVKQDAAWKEASIRGAINLQLALPNLAELDQGAIEGSLSLQDLQLQGPHKNWSVEQAQLKLPIHWRAQSEAALEHGSLVAEGVQLGRWQFEKVLAKPYMVAGQLSLSEPLDLKTDGLALRLSHFKLDKLLQLKPSMQADWHLAELDLGMMSKHYGGAEIEGTLRGKLPAVVWDQQGLNAQEGALTASLLGGELRVTELHGAQLWHPTPRWGAEMTFANLSMPKLSKLLGVGQVDGVGQVIVQDLLMEGAEAKRYDLHFYTTGQPNSRRISLDAVRSLNILNGGKAGSLDKGMYALFQFYRYNQLGFRMRKEEERYHIKGVTKSQGSDYILQGGVYPPRVDLILQDPVVSREQMDERIAQVQKMADQRRLKAEQKRAAEAAKKSADEAGKAKK